ncbi:MAG: tRNA (adenosine(37)-N6)-dimethylallyltransferase MiaA [Solirubrobacterales bacterium]
MGLHLVAVFGPTGIGKTGTAIELAALLRERGEEPVAINCDAIQVYKGLETISGAASAEEQRQLEHRLLGFVPLTDEFSAGKYAERAHAEIDGLLAEGRRPILVGGTGLYLRAALAEIAFRPAVPEALRQEVERQLEAEGPAALHATLPAEFQESIHPNDRKRIARTIELIRDGQTPARNHQGGGDLWTASMRQPSLLFGLAEEDDVLTAKIDRRIDAMEAAGAAAEVERADQGGASRTARAAIGFTEFLSGDLERLKLLHRRYGRRQMTWMRRMEGIRMIERQSRPDRQVAGEILDRIDSIEGQNADSAPCG